MNKKIRVIFFGSSDFSVYSLIELHRDTSIEVDLVITKKDKRVGRGERVVENMVSIKAKELGIPVLKVSSLLRDPTQLNVVDWGNIDYGIVVSFGFIFPSDILCQLSNRFINLHPSLLPKYRGPSPIHNSIINGDVSIGNSVIIVTENVDSGPVLCQEEIGTSPNESFKVIYSKLALAGAKLLVRSVRDYHEGLLLPKEQNHSLATYTRMLKKDDGFVTLQEYPTEVYNKYRALEVWPGIYTTVAFLENFTHQKTKIKNKKTIVKLREVALINSLKAISREYELQIQKVQLPNKPVITWSDFVNGYVLKS